MIKNFISYFKTFFTGIGQFSYFVGRFFKEIVRPPLEFDEILKQCYNMGNRSLILVSLTGFIIGLVFTLQSRPTLMEFGAVSWLPAMVTISIVREIGPIITALICAGKIGSGIGAELGSMRVTEQIDAMEVSGTNPYKFLVVTRVLATTLMLPILVVFGDAIAIFGSYLVESIKGDVSFALFFNLAFKKLEFSDVFPALLKSFFFGFAISMVGCYQGYNCEKGTSGVGNAANTAVVHSSILVFLIDFIVVIITNIFIN